MDTATFAATIVAGQEVVETYEEWIEAAKEASDPEDQQKLNIELVRIQLATNRLTALISTSLFGFTPSQREDLFALLRQMEATSTRAIEAHTDLLRRLYGESAAQAATDLARSIVES